MKVVRQMHICEMMRPYLRARFINNVASKITNNAIDRGFLQDIGKY